MVSCPPTFLNAWLMSGTVREKAMGSPWASATSASSGTTSCFRSFASLSNSASVMGTNPQFFSQAEL